MRHTCVYLQRVRFLQPYLQKELDMPYSKITELEYVDRFNALSPIPIECPKNQLVSLTLQIEGRRRIILGLKYRIRKAKRNSRYQDARRLVNDLDAVKFQIRALRNQKNRLWNLLTRPAHNDNEPGTGRILRSAA